MEGNTNPVQAALEAFKAGEDVEQAVYGTPEEAPVEQSDESVEEESLEASEQSEEEESAVVEEDDSQVEASDAQEVTDVEEIFVTDHRGRHKVKIDYSDREKIKKYVAMAAGGKKWKVEKDQLASKVKELEPKYKELRSMWDELNELYEDGGPAALINRISGDEEAWSNLVKSEVEKARALEDASPAELERIKLQEELEKERKLRERTLRQQEKLQQERELEREATSRKELESQIHPTFDKYRFAGQLGDSEAEERLDAAIWSTALSNLQTLPDDVELTKTIIDREFRNVANSFRKVLKNQATNETKKVITKKKQDASQKVAAAAMKGITTNSDRDAHLEQIKQGNLKDSLAALLSGNLKF